MLNSSAQQRDHLRPELLIAALVQRRTNLLHEGIVKVEVVHDRQTHSKHLARLEQVADIGAAVALADRAVAFRVDWGIVQLIFCVVDVDDALPGEQVAVARIAECIVKDEHAVLPVSTVLQGEYGLKGLALSIPSVVGKSGVETVLEIPLSAQESAELQASAGGLRRVIATLPL